MLLIEEDEEGCLQPRRTPWIGTASTAGCTCASSSPSHGILSPPSCGTLSPLPWSLGSPIPPRTQACTPERISSSPFLSQSSSHAARAISKRHPSPNPPTPMPGCTGDHPSHPQGGTNSHCRFGRNGESCLPAPRRLLECPGDC